MPENLKATPEMVSEYARWFVNRRAYVRQSNSPHRESGQHYYFRPKADDGGDLPLTEQDLERHLAGEITISLYAINPTSQCAKWMAIDADYRTALEDLLKLQYQLGREGLQAALEQSRRGGHLWIFFETPVLASLARRYIRHLATRLSVNLKKSGRTEGIELFPRQNTIEPDEFGNAIRAPLGVHRGANRRYWFYGSAYDLESQMAYLRGLKRVTVAELEALVSVLPEEKEEECISSPRRVSFAGRGFQIADYINLGHCRRVGRNWVTQCPSCHAGGRDRSKDNLAISVAEPQKYICWAGCTREEIRAALGAPLPTVSRY